MIFCFTENSLPQTIHVQETNPPRQLPLSDPPLGQHAKEQYFLPNFTCDGKARNTFPQVAQVISIFIEKRLSWLTVTLRHGQPGSPEP
jgi:hypothetical protein